MRTVFLLTLVTLTANCFGQVDTTNIYSQALKYYNIHLDKDKFGEAEIFIEDDSEITDKLPEKIGNRQVTILTWKNQRDIFLKHNKWLGYIKVYPAMTKDNLIEIYFTRHSGEYKGKRKGIRVSDSGWVIIQFKFDCSDNKFKYWNTKTDEI